MLWVPRRMVSDCWLASAPLGPDGERQYGPHRVLTLWWLTWLASMLLTRVAGSWRSGAGLQELRTHLGIGIVADLTEIAAAGLAITLVVRLTAMQDVRAVVNPVRPAHPDAVTSPVS